MDLSKIRSNTQVMRKILRLLAVLLTVWLAISKILALGNATYISWWLVLTPILIYIIWRVVVYGVYGVAIFVSLVISSRLMKR